MSNSSISKIKKDYKCILKDLIAQASPAQALSISAIFRQVLLRSAPLI